MPLKHPGRTGKAEPGPQRPKRVIYAILPTSDTPVAEQYTTLASGSRCCMLNTAWATYSRTPACQAGRHTAEHPAVQLYAGCQQ